MLILRVSRPSDVPAVSRLFEASYPTQMAAAYTPEQLARALPAMTRAQTVLLASGRFAVIEQPAPTSVDEGNGLPTTIVACGGYSLERPGSSGSIVPGVGHIRHFATHPAATRTGLGRRIYRWCVDAARQDGCRLFECYAALNAVSFYRAVGFEVTREDSITLGGVPFPVAIMHAQI